MARKSQAVRFAAGEDLSMLKVPPLAPQTPPPPEDEPAVPPRSPLVYVKEQPPRWEYKVLALQPGDGSPSETALNELGADGWELVAVTAQAATTHFYFKRQTR